MRLADTDAGQPGLEVARGDDDRWLLGYEGAVSNRRGNGQPPGVHVALLGTPSPPGEDSDGDVVAATTSLALVERAYRRMGARAGEAIEGAYAAVIVDPADEVVLLINDVVGTFPIYWSVVGGRFVWGTTLRGVTAASESAPALNPRAAADYLHFGFLLGTKTLTSDVELVPPGSAVAYHWRDGRVRAHRHTAPASLFCERGAKRSDYLARVRKAFNNAVGHASRDAEGLGLSLSGGLDSRAILSALPRGAHIRTYTVGVRSCADEVIASKLSRLWGTEHHFLALEQRYLRDFLPNLERMVRLTDGMYLSHGLTEVLALTALRRSGIRTLLRGHGGELAKTRLAWPSHTDATVMGMRDRAEFTAYYYRRINYVSREVAVTGLFSADYRRLIDGAARRSLDEALEEAPGLTPANLCSYLYLTQHHRRFTVPSVELFRREVDVRMPFVDVRFLRELFSGPPEWREGSDIHRYITGENDARLLSVRNSNTGAPASAGPLLERVLDPVNSVLKRLNVPGYRHYHDFDAWMRTQLLQSVEEVLLDRTTAQRGVYDTHALRRLIDETRSGAADRAYLLQVLLVMELWQRQRQLAAVPA